MGGWDEYWRSELDQSIIVYSVGSGKVFGGSEPERTVRQRDSNGYVPGGDYRQIPITRGIFFSLDVSPEETKGKINIYLSRVKAKGLSGIPSVTQNLPKNELM